MSSPVIFLKETYDELRKVVWPSKEEVIRLTVIVILISVLVGLYIGGLDLLFTEILKIIV